MASLTTVVAGVFFLEQCGTAVSDQEGAVAESLGRSGTGGRDCRMGRTPGVKLRGF